MDKYGSIDQNWYSSENQKHEREKGDRSFETNERTRKTI